MSKGMTLSSETAYGRDLTLFHPDSREWDRAYAELVLVFAINDVLIDLETYRRPTSFVIRNRRVEDIVWSYPPRTDAEKEDLIAAKVGAWEWFFCPWNDLEPRYPLERVCEVLDVDPNAIRDFVEDVTTPPGRDMSRDERRKLFVDCELVENFEDLENVPEDELFESQGSIWRMIREDRVQPGSGRRRVEPEGESEEDLHARTIFAIERQAFAEADPMVLLRVGPPDPETSRIISAAFGVEVRGVPADPATSVVMLPVLSYLTRGQEEESNG